MTEWRLVQDGLTALRHPQKTDERVLRLLNSYGLPDERISNDQFDFFTRFDLRQVEIKCDLPAELLFSLERLYPLLEMMHSARLDDLSILAEVVGSDVQSIERLASEIDEDGKKLLWKLRLFFARKFSASSDDRSISHVTNSGAEVIELPPAKQLG